MALSPILKRCEAKVGSKPGITQEAALEEIIEPRLLNINVML